MLAIVLPATDQFESLELDLEHSLISLSKWESKYEKPFFSSNGLAPEELMDYISMMIVGDRPPKNLRHRITSDQIMLISDYISSKQTATWFREEQNSKKTSEAVTSELIYYWLVQFNIDFYPTETWHINRLMTLVKICGIKQTPPKKMSKSEQAEHMRRLNAQRREQLGTKG